MWKWFAIIAVLIIIMCWAMYKIEEVDTDIPLVVLLGIVFFTGVGATILCIIGLITSCVNV